MQIWTRLQILYFTRLKGYQHIYWLVLRFTNRIQAISRLIQLWLHLWNDVTALQWRHNGRDGVSDHLPQDCLFNHLFRCRWKETSKLRDTGLCVGNSPVTGEFPAQKTSNAKNVSIWWCHHNGRSSNACMYVLWDQKCSILRNAGCDSQKVDLPIAHCQFR